ncbi:MAG: DNA-binding response regulator [Citrobacter freundii]|nr:MAG: DNA-binding response regulator [Citrobacter freundii]
MKSIFFLEDETVLAEIVQESLIMQGFCVYHFTTISEALKKYVVTSPDIFILDVKLPDGDGFSFLKKIRHAGCLSPAIFLTSRSLPSDVVLGFESGANDYLKKPFSMEELHIRIKSLLGLVNNEATLKKSSKQIIQIGEYEFYYPQGLLVYQGSPKQLTFREAEILYTLVCRSGQLLTRQELLLKHWGKDDYFTGRSLDVFITKLRKYLGNDPAVAVLNFRGKGYKLMQ